MEKSYQVLKRSVEQIGVKAVAAVLKLSPALVYKWCEEPSLQESPYQSCGAVNPLDRLMRIYEITQDQMLINWVCKAAGGFFIKDPMVERVSGYTEMFRKTQKLIKEFSDTLNAISQAYSDDNVNSQEAQRIRSEWEELKRAGETLVHECESGLYREISPKKKSKSRTSLKRRS